MGDRNAWVRDSHGNIIGAEVDGRKFNVSLSEKDREASKSKPADKK